jgi:hypothetical protein
MQNNLMDRLTQAGITLQQHGAEMIQALLILVVGLAALHWLMRRLKTLFDKMFVNRARAATVFSCIYVLLLTSIIAITLVQLGNEIEQIIT